MTAITLHHGRWQDVLSDCTGYALICDPPFSERTHKGQRSGDTHRDGVQAASAIDYAPIDAETVREFVEHWTQPGKIERWFCIFSDHIGANLWLAALEKAGLYVFSPVVWVKNDPGPRFSGDGPASAVEYLCIARHRHAMARKEKRSRVGFYKGNIARERVVTGGKPLWLMRAVVRDYSEENTTVIDPFAGGATTLLAARIEQRKAIGAEMNKTTFDGATERINKGFTPDLFTA